MNIVILAAGKGKRMFSDLPKVLHPLAGQALLSHVLNTARQLQPQRICVVVGHGAEQVRQQVAASDIQFVEQTQQLGTGHALQQALPYLDTAMPTLVLYGDVPLTRLSSLQALLAAAGSEQLAILTAQAPNPFGFGRILRQQGEIVAIVEEKDASAEQKQIAEINTGIMAIPTQHLNRWLARLSNNNAQGEYYLTDIVAAAVADGVKVSSAQPANYDETTGVNSKTELLKLERVYQRSLADQLLAQGVHVYDAGRIDIRGNLQCGRDVVIDVGCVFEGEVSLADGVQVGPYCVIKDAKIAAGTVLRAYSHIEQAEVGAAAQIGPFARLRPGTVLAEEVHIGNFVEVKNSQIAAQSKANHLAYVGDATVGSKVNIGAGVITCNYDGANKFRTVIEDEVFVGSDTQLIAPITVGKGATIGAGTTLTKDAPAGKLTVSRPKQITIDNWQRPQKQKKPA